MQAVLSNVWRRIGSLTISEVGIDGIYSFKDRAYADSKIVELDTTYTITGYNIEIQ